MSTGLESTGLESTGAGSAELAEARDELRAVARDQLVKSGPEPSWQALARSGWLGLDTEPGLGGSGATFAETAVIAEELGRAAAISPYLGAIVLGAGALSAVRSSPFRDELLSDVVAGRRLVSVALATGDQAVSGSGDRTVNGDGHVGGDVAPFRAESAGGRVRLRGRAAFVPDAAGADVVLLLARNHDREPVIVAVPVTAAAPVPGLHVQEQPVLDATRRLATVTADGLAVGQASVWNFAAEPGAAAAVLADRAALAVACDSLGLSEAMLAATVSYARQRHQFGRPIGSFQAVKHACADMLVQVSLARELVREAAIALADGAAGAPAAVSMAKSYTCSAAVDVAGKAMQLHGGIGYTWEGPIHPYLKRAMLNRSLFGSPQAHRQRLARRYG